MKRFFVVVSLLLFLVGCTSTDEVVFVNDITIEYGDRINPYNWVKTGLFDDIRIDKINPNHIGTQEIIVTVEHKNKETYYPLQLTILDTQGPEITKLKEFEVPIKSEVTISEFFHAQDLRDGNIIIEHTPIDTSSLGAQRILVWAIDTIGNRTQKEVIMNVIDINPPIITQNEEFLVLQGETFEITDFFTIEDEQEGYLEITLENEYDNQELGHYPVVIVAKDPSGNEARYETVLTIYTEDSDASDGYKVIEDAIIRNDRYTLVNKRYQLPYDYIPNNLVLFPEEYRIGDANATLETVAAFVEMAEAAKKDDVILTIQRGFVSYWNQGTIFNQTITREGFDIANTKVLRPGHSEHQLGVAIDICEAKTHCEEAFNDTDSDLWLRQHAADYGFILRYPEDKEGSTLLSYMSYHYRYVGKEVAHHYNTLDLSYDEYYQQFSDRLQ